jgi:hypothetical protein
MQCKVYIYNNEKFEAKWLQRTHSDNHRMIMFRTAAAAAAAAAAGILILGLIGLRPQPSVL